MRIRNMIESDYEAVRALWLALPGIGLNYTDDSLPGIAKYLRRNPTTCFVAEEDGEIVGTILSGHDGRRGYIYHAAVRVAAQGRGIGSALAERALDALKKEGITKAALVCFAGNAAGNGFWQRQGFAVRHDLVYRNKAVRHDEG